MKMRTNLSIRLGSHHWDPITTLAIAPVGVDYNTIQIEIADDVHSISIIGSYSEVEDFFAALTEKFNEVKIKSAQAGTAPERI